MATLQDQMSFYPRVQPQGKPQGKLQGSTPGLNPRVESPRNVSGADTRAIAHVPETPAQNGLQAIRTVRRQDLHYLLNRARAAIEQAEYYRLPCVRPNVDDADLWLGWRLLPEDEGWFPIMRDGQRVTPGELVEQLVAAGWVTVEE
jgi:hypothetical protein